MIHGQDRRQIFRFIVNGLVAMSVHFAVLTFNITVLGVRSAGLANAGAAVAGITVSFLGSRYYVFRVLDESIQKQAMKFAGLYVATAAVHGLTLLVWSDVAGLDYRLGFLLATTIQVVLSYLGNKKLVFNK